MLSHHLLPDKYYLVDHQYVDWPSMFTTTSFTLTHRQEEVRAEWGKAKTSGNQAERMDIEVQKPMKNLEQANSFIHRLYLYRALRGCLHACRWVSVGAWQTRWSRPIQGERGRCEVALLCLTLPWRRIQRMLEPVGRQEGSEGGGVGRSLIASSGKVDLSGRSKFHLLCDLV